MLENSSHQNISWWNTLQGSHEAIVKPIAKSMHFYIIILSSADLLNAISFIHLMIWAELTLQTAATGAERQTLLLPVFSSSQTEAPPRSLRPTPPSPVFSSTSPSLYAAALGLFQGMSGTVAMHRIQPGVSCSPVGPCENMNVRFHECQLVTFRTGPGFVTLRCHLHLVDIFWTRYSYAETHLFPWGMQGRRD